MSKEESGRGVHPWGCELPCSGMEGGDAERGADTSSARAWGLVEARPGPESALLPSFPSLAVPTPPLLLARHPP